MEQREVLVAGQTVYVQEQVVAFDEAVRVFRGPGAREVVEGSAGSVEDEQARQAVVSVEEKAEGLAGGFADGQVGQEFVAVVDPEPVVGSGAQVQAAGRGQGGALFSLGAVESCADRADDQQQRADGHALAGVALLFAAGDHDLLVVLIAVKAGRRHAYRMA
ncbi:hypothetical protein ABGB18_12220 [Nonomuraea sp. B12E4]|uniref:hypothetical protein n=1 Tax=Nonomuraea sp. B12E4 TaxID=3153564 RepID=UPI00325C57DF